MGDQHVPGGQAPARCRGCGSPIFSPDYGGDLDDFHADDRSPAWPRCKRPPMEGMLSGLALDIWRRVVIDGEHLHLVTSDAEVVVVPIADYGEMVAAASGPKEDDRG